MPRAILSATARHYADAAFAVAQQAGQIDQWLATLDGAAGVLSNREAYAAFTSPVIRHSDKSAALERLQPGATPAMRNFVNILVDRDRIAELPDIAVAFRELVNEARSILTAEVTTAVPLDSASEQTLAKRLGAYLHHDPSKLVIQSRVDPNIIGGVIAQVGDTLIDDSVRGRISRLRRVIAVGR